MNLLLYACQITYICVTIRVLKNLAICYPSLAQIKNEIQLDIKSSYNLTHFHIRTHKQIHKFIHTYINISRAGSI